MYKIIDGKQVEMTAEEVTAHTSWTVTNAEKLEKIKDIRLEKLQETDFWVLRGDITDAQKLFRKNLRDIPTNYDSSKYDELLNRDSDGKLTHTIWEKP